MNVPSVLKEAECMGEQAYGQELLNPELEEKYLKYQILYSGEKGILIVNNGVYGSSFCGEEGTLKITLLRSPSYCAHPIPGRTTMPQDRYMPYIDQGEHDFSFFRFWDKGEKCCSRHPGQHRNFRHRPCCCLAIRLKNPEKKTLRYSCFIQIPFSLLR